MGKRARRLKREKKLQPMILCVDRYGKPLYKLTHSEYMRRYNAEMERLAAEPPNQHRHTEQNVDHRD